MQMSTSRRGTAKLMRALRIGSAVVSLGFAANAFSQTTTLQTKANELAEKWRDTQLAFVVRSFTGEVVEANNTRGLTAALPVASLSKAITGLAVGVLIQEGKLSLEDTVGDRLDAYFKARNKSMDDSLRPVTVRRLLTHTAGLRANYSTDPVNGIDNGAVFMRMRPGDALDYVVTADAARSTGESKFLYSNVSYALLGFMIEQVSGEKYEDFCKSRVLDPAGVNDAKLSFKHRGLAAFAGWQLQLRDLVKVWDQFDPARSVVLKPQTIRSLLHQPLAGPVTSDGRTHYALGNYVRANQDRTRFILSHDGRSNFFRSDPEYSLYVESRPNGAMLAAVASPVLSREKKQALLKQIRILATPAEPGSPSSPDE